MIIGHNKPPSDKPVRCFQRYDHNIRANHAASHRLGHRQRERLGEYYWTVGLIPGIAFSTRKAALIALEERDRN